MPSESVDFNILARDQASSSFRSVGNAALDASAKIDVAAASLKLFSDTTQKQGKAATTSVNAMQAHAKAAKLLADAENVLGGRATVTTKLMTDQAKATEDAAAKADSATSRFSALAGLAGGGGGVGGSGMAAVIGAGVALAPVVVTLGFGLAGLAAAAYGIYKPISNAAQATGGLSANLKTLSPEQQQVAKGLLGLGQQFGAFQKQVQPGVFTIFNQGIRLAGTLLHDVEPVANATGKALGGLLGQVDKEFQSGTWQQFFGFMARTAPSDIALLGASFVNLLDAIPKISQDLAPLSQAILVTTKDSTGLVNSLSGWVAQSQKLPGSTQQTFNFLRSLDAETVKLTNAIPGGKAINDWLTGVQHSADGAGAGAGQAASGLKKVGAAAAGAAPAVQRVATATKNLMTAQQNALTAATTYAGDILTTANDGIALEKALDASKNKIGLHTAAQRASFGAANTFITDLANQATQAYNSGHGVDASIAAIKRGLPILDSAKTKNHAYWQEVQILVGWLQKLEQQKQAAFNAKITGQGTWNVQGLPGSLSAHVHGAGHAAGWRVPGTGSGDTVPAMLTPGETVVPKHLTPAVAPLMKAHGVPGFASGGIAGYKGPIAGLQPWGQSSWNKALNLVVSDVAASEAHTFSAALKAAQAAAARSASSGFGISPTGPLQTYARKLLAAYGWSAQWNDFNDIVMRESGWNVHAQNPSGAYGIPQALPGNKMASAGSDWQTNGFTQLRWMMGYIKSRWGSPLNADFNERMNHWYGSGTSSAQRGWAVVGERGPELVNFRGGEQVHPAGSGGREIVLRIEGSDQNLVSALVYAMRHHVRVAGGGSVQKALGYQ